MLAKTLRLAGALLLIAVLWVGVLPRVAGISTVERRIELQESRGIDPTALFYTELPERLLRPLLSRPPATVAGPGDLEAR